MNAEKAESKTAAALICRRTMRTGRNTAEAVKPTALRKTVAELRRKPDSYRGLRGNGDSILDRSSVGLQSLFDKTS